MGIYQRDNINYGGMLGNAMAQRANIIQRDYDNYMKQPMAWANAVQNSGKIAQDALMSMAKYKYDENQADLNRQQQLDVLKKQQDFNRVENDLNRKNTLAIAQMNNANTLASRESEARTRLEKLFIQKSTLEAAGQDTRDINASIAQIMRDYPSIAQQVKGDLARQEPYDPTKDVRFQLAKYKDVNAKDYDTGVLFEAYNALQPYKTPEAIGRLGEIEHQIEIAQVQDELNKQLKDEISKFNGGLSPKLANNGYTVEYAGPVINLVSKTGSIVKQVPRKTGKAPSKPSTNWD